MSRDGSGNYSLPLPPVVTGTFIEATWANTTLDDIKAALTDSLSRSGNGSMSAQIKLIDGTVSVPSLGWVNEASSGLYRAASNDLRFTVNGTDTMRWTSANGVQIFSGAWKKVGFSSMVKFDDSGSAVGGVFTQADADQFTVFCAGTAQGTHGQFKAYSGTHSTQPGQVEFGNSSVVCRFDPATSVLTVPGIIDRGVTGDSLQIVGGDGEFDGAYLEVFGSTGASANDFRFISNAEQVIRWDESTKFLNLGKATGCTIRFFDDIAFADSTGGTFTTPSGGALDLYGGAVAGGGAQLTLYGPSHGTKPAHIELTGGNPIITTNEATPSIVFGDAGYEVDIQAQHVDVFAGGVRELRVDTAGVLVDNLTNGAVYSNAGYLTNTDPSDRRLKQFIDPVNEQRAEESVIGIEPKTFQWKSKKRGEGVQYGFIAQDVQKYLPELVEEGPDGRLGIKSSQLVPVLWQAVRELMLRVEELEAKQDLL